MRCGSDQSPIHTPQICSTVVTDRVHGERRYPACGTVPAHEDHIVYTDTMCFGLLVHMITEEMFLWYGHDAHIIASEIRILTIRTTILPFTLPEELLLHVRRREILLITDQ